MTKPKVIQLQTELSDDELDQLGRKWRKEHDLPFTEEMNNIAGTYLDDSHYDILVDDENVNVLKPDGSQLLLYRPNALSGSACKAAFDSLRKAATEAGNRGIAAGIIAPDEQMIINRPAVKATKGSSTRMKPIKKDGTLSNTSYAKQVPSGVIGFMDRNSRFPYCRLTAFNMNHPEKFAKAMPFIKAISKLFEKELPDRYLAQKEFIEKTTPDFVIPGTVFTTVTVNKSWQTAVHKDAGDLKAGFGVMAALRAGYYNGCYLVFPKYRVAVNLCTQGVCFADVHEWHSNTPIVGVAGCYERISCVLYAREKMIFCKNAKEERERAKRRKPGGKINDD